MLEWIVAKAGVEATQYAAGGLVAVGLAWAFKKIPNEKHSLTLRIFPHYFYNLITLASL